MIKTIICRKLKKLICFFLIVITLLTFSPQIVEAKIQLSEMIEGEESYRSLESLRDLDYQTWQVVAYQKKGFEKTIVLRIVGYPGTLRLNHPANLKVESGIKSWNLDDITLKNIQLAKDIREAAVEFDLAPLIIDLTNNRPLRLFLPGAFNELPVPPYVVKEWRALILDKSLNEE